MTWRWDAISKAQDAVHHLAGALADGYRGHSTFEHRYLHERLQNYEYGIGDVDRLDDMCEDEGLEPIGHRLFCSPERIESDEELARNATEALMAVLRWCADLKIDPWHARDLITGATT